MILNQEVQKKVQAEIDRVVGRNRFPNATDRSRWKCSLRVFLTLNGTFVVL